MVSEVQVENRVVRNEMVVFDYLRKLEQKGIDGAVLYVCLHKLTNVKLRSTNKKAVNDTFNSLLPDGKLFVLSNDDLVVVYDKSKHEEALSCLVKLRFLLHDDPIIRMAEDLEQIEFVKFYNVAEQKSELREQLQRVIGEGQSSLKPEMTKNIVFDTSTRRVKKGLSPEMLSKVQKILSVADFSSFIRRQAICAIIGKSSPQRVFEEVYVSVPDLRDMLLPDVDLTSNPWLFLSLSETLDQKVLETIGRHDDGSLIGNFSVNVNVSTILSDNFLSFDDNINVSMRSSVILELQLVDIFSDIKSYMLAKTFAKARGYKICIDGITVDKLKYLNRTNLDCDLMKIIWHPTFMDVIREDKHFMDYVNKAERAKMILCRIDDAAAVEVGNSLGINLYQGRYVQRLLSQQMSKGFLGKK
ncbi:MAG: hypothetical protein E7018_02915 [Alphaproteobacteria bacterium]|nr:hypothetical protein [Alphaproteobacteria bacterium]